MNMVSWSVIFMLNIRGLQNSTRCDCSIKDSGFVTCLSSALCHACSCLTTLLLITLYVFTINLCFTYGWVVTRFWVIVIYALNVSLVIVLRI